MNTTSNNPSPKNQLYELEQIYASDLPELEKLKQGFQWLTNLIIQQGENEIELLKALHDHEALVKEQIKVSTLKHAQVIFNECYRRSTQKAGKR
jgi:hypothetical protein